MPIYILVSDEDVVNTLYTLFLIIYVYVILAKNSGPNPDLIWLGHTGSPSMIASCQKLSLRYSYIS